MAHKYWFKFCPKDWQTDQALRQVSLAARGLWIELICIMHNCDPYGHLVDKQGRPMALTTIRNMVLPRNEEDVGDLLEELERAGVIYFTGSDGVRILYSKRMVEDSAYSEQQAKFGRKGGNPKLTKDKRKKPPLSHDDKGGLKATLKPEKESEKENPDSFSDSESRARADAALGGTAPRAISRPVKIADAIPKAANGNGHHRHGVTKPEPIAPFDDEVPL